MKISNATNNINDVKLGENLLHKSGISKLIAISNILDFSGDTLNMDDRQLLIFERQDNKELWSFKITNDLDMPGHFRSDQVGVLKGYEIKVKKFRPYF